MRLGPASAVDGAGTVTVSRQRVLVFLNPVHASDIHCPPELSQRFVGPAQGRQDVRARVDGPSFEWSQAQGSVDMRQPLGCPPVQVEDPG